MSYNTDCARLKELLQELSVEKREVILASGEKSDVYVDCKKTILMGEGHLLAGRLLFQMVDSMFYDRPQAVAGVALGGCPLASAVSLTAALSGWELPAIYVRKTAKDHGTKAELEHPPLDSGIEVVLVEDVVTSGKSSVEAAQKLLGAGFKVSGVLSLIDRGAGGKEALGDLEIPLYSLFTLKELL